MNVFDKLLEEKIVPVIKLKTADSAVHLSLALQEGGINVAEITFRTDAAGESIKKIKGNFPGMLVGAGTVLTLENAIQAMDAGAAFIVAPGFNPRIVEFCQSKNVPVIPGVNSPSQVEMAMEMGLKYLKFFPAALSGGIPMLKTLGSVYNVSFIPTGGLNGDNFIDYLMLPNVIACGGSWMVKSDWIDSGQFKEITKAAVRVRDQIKKAFGYE